MSSCSDSIDATAGTRASLPFSASQWPSNQGPTKKSSNCAQPDKQFSESHAGRLAKRLDATRPSLKRLLTETEKQQLKALYTDGAPLNAIAAQLHIYKARIHREIAAMGIERRSERRSETVLSPGQTETLLKLYFNTDTSVRAIVNVLDTCVAAALI